MEEENIKPEEEVVEEKTKEQEAEETLKTIRETNKEIKAEIAEQEELKAKVALGGQTEAGRAPIEKKPETDKEYTERFLKGEVDPLT